MIDKMIKKTKSRTEGKAKRKKISTIIVSLILVMLVVGCGEQSVAERGGVKAVHRQEPTQKAQTGTESDMATETEAAEEESGAQSGQDTMTSDEENMDIQPALMAYQDYIDSNIMFDKDSLEQWNSDKGGICTLIYVDDDDVPECFFYMYYGMPVLLRYKNGQVLATDGDFSYSSCRYQEKTGKFCFISTPGGNKIHTFVEVSPDTDDMTVTGMAHALTVLGGPGAEPYYAILDDDSTEVDNIEDLTQVDKVIYEEYINSFGDYIDINQETMSPSVEDAYKILEKMEAGV